MSEAASANRLARPLVVLLIAIAGLALTATLALWAHYGTAVFLEMIRAGIATCFG
jgi:hypothetical protein